MPRMSTYVVWISHVDHAAGTSHAFRSLTSNQEGQYHHSARTSGQDSRAQTLCVHSSMLLSYLTNSTLHKNHLGTLNEAWPYSSGVLRQRRVTPCHKPSFALVCARLVPVSSSHIIHSTLFAQQTSLLYTTEGWAALDTTFLVVRG